MLVFMVSACNSTEFAGKASIPESTVKPTKMSTAISTVTNTPTVEPSATDKPTATQVPTHDIHVHIWHDYNGDGIWEDEEPAIAGVVASSTELITGETLSSCTTGDEGACTIVGVPQGDQHLNVSAPSQFNWILPSVSKVIPIELGLNFNVSDDDQNNIIDVPLGQGFLSLPFQCGSSAELIQYFDLEPGPGVRNYLGEDYGVEKNTLDYYHLGNGNDHPGIDFGPPFGEPIYASAPGDVVFAGKLPNGSLGVTISHGFAQIHTSYGHIDEILVRDDEIVLRGELIGYGGTSGTSWVHLHYGVYDVSDKVINPPPIDPFRNIYDNASVTYWTVDNTPQCISP